MAEPIVINAETREITVPETERAFGVAGERKVEVKHIRIEGRTVDGTDLTQGFSWKVSCENAGKELCADLIDGIVADAGNIEFDWIVGAAPMAYKGTMHFAVCAVRVDAAGNILQEWHSKLGAGDVANGIEATVQNIGGQDLLAHIQSITAAAQQNAAAAQRDAAAAAKSAEDAATSEGNAAASAKKAQDVSDSLPADYKTMSGDVDTLKNQMQLAYPDNTAPTDATWSARKTLAVLCDEVTASGNPVELEDVCEVEAVASWEPVQEGSGDPSPDNIRAINGRNKVAVTCCGENLINTRNLNFTSNGVTVRSDDEGNITATGTQSGGGWIVAASVKLPAGTYYFSSTSPSKFVPLVEYTQVAVGKIVLTKRTTVRIGLVGIPADGITGKVMIVRGDTAPAEYIPYVGQTNTLTLPETVYGGNVDARTGEGQETWKTVTLDGNSNFTERSGKVMFLYNFCDDWNRDRKYLSSHYSPFMGGWDNIPNQSFKIVDNALGIRDDRFTSLDDFKSYIAAQHAAGTPVQICYKLAAPEAIQATGGAALAPVEGKNTVMTDADTLSVTAKKAPLVRLGELRKEYKATVGELETAQRDIRVLKKLSKGQVWDFEEKTEDAYVRQVPDGAYAAGVQMWGGKTVAWNNYFSFNIVNPDMTVKNNKIVFTNSNPSKSFSAKKLDSAIPVGHKIYRAVQYLQGKTGNCSYTAYGGYYRGDGSNALWSGFFTIPSNSVFDGSQIEAVIESVANPVTDMWIYMPGENAEIIEPVTVEIIFCDLTLMFGTGNEPTTTDDPRIAWIEQYAAAHQEYNAGKLVSAEVDEVVEHGKNLLEPDSIVYLQDNIHACMKIEGKDGFLLRKGVTYTLSTDTSSGIYIKSYDMSVTLAQEFNAASVSYTPTENVLASFDAYWLDGRPTSATLQLEVGSYATAHSDYSQNRYLIPTAVCHLPGYGWSDGTAKNTVERTADGKWQYVQRVGKVELDGTESLNYYNSVERGLVATIICMPEVMPGEAIGLCSLYKFVKNSVWSGETENCVFFSNDKTLGLSLDLSTATSFGFDGTNGTIPKTVKAMLETYKSRGTPLSITYPLNTPIVTDITDLMGTDALNFEVEPGGSITMHNATELPVPATIQYVEKLSEVVSND